jgi:hypothetical protein
MERRTFIKTIGAMAFILPQIELPKVEAVTPAPAVSELGKVLVQEDNLWKVGVHVVKIVDIQLKPSAMHQEDNFVFTFESLDSNARLYRYYSPIRGHMFLMHDLHLMGAMPVHDSVDLNSLIQKNVVVRVSHREYNKRLYNMVDVVGSV